MSDDENAKNDSDSEDDIEATSMINDYEDGHENDDNDDDDDDDDIDDGGDGTEAHEINFDVDVASTENVDPIHISQQQAQNPPSLWAGFKIVGDNLDKNIRPSFQ